MRSLEGANCADLLPFVADKYFDCNVSQEPLKARVAKAICARCVVREECRDEALTMPFLPLRGVIGGVNAAEIHHARRWRRYEEGEIDQVPPMRRPEWLAVEDAGQITEQQRIELDPDEATDT